MDRRRGLVLVGVVSLVAGCGGHYPQQELRDGIEIDVDDPEGLVESAWLIWFDGLPDPIQLSAEIGRSSSGSVVIEPGSDGYHVVVAYVTGPACAVVPAVTVFSDDSSIVVDVESKRRGDCADMQYAEAIGINFTAARDSRRVSVRHERP